MLALLGAGQLSAGACVGSADQGPALPTAQGAIAAALPWTSLILGSASNYCLAGRQAQPHLHARAPHPGPVHGEGGKVCSRNVVRFIAGRLAKACHRATEQHLVLERTASVTHNILPAPWTAVQLGPRQLQAADPQGAGTSLTVAHQCHRRVEQRPLQGLRHQAPYCGAARQCQAAEHVLACGGACLRALPDTNLVSGISTVMDRKVSC